MTESSSATAPVGERRRLPAGTRRTGPPGLRFVSLAPCAGDDTAESWRYDALKRSTQTQDDDSTVNLTYDGLQGVTEVAHRMGACVGPAMTSRRRGRVREVAANAA